MGGALAILSSVHVPEADAVVTWYGYPSIDFVDASRIKAPLMGHFALNDAFFPIAGVDDLERKLHAAGLPFQFHRYDARHAFANETAVNAAIPIEYNEEAAELAWERTLSFLGAHLQP
jgi:carboxymethylenebutenolidase